MTFNGASAAVSLTYDDGMPGHLDAAMPDLEACSLRGTFYLMTGGGGNSTWVTRPNDWVAAAQRGHELGNHTRFHPCRHSTFSPDLCGYTHAQIAEEVEGCERDLAEAVGILSRSFAYPCCHTTVGPDDQMHSYTDVVGRLYPAARGGGDVLADPEKVDLLQVPSLVITDARPLEWVVEQIDSAIAARQWAVLMFHGIGEGHMVTSRKTHQGICQAVAQRVTRGQLYCGTFVDVGSRIRAER